MDSLAGKRIVVLGLARQGEALARFAAGVGAEVVVSDLRPADALQQQLHRLNGIDITYVFGEHPMTLLDGTDVVAVSGGVPLSAPIVTVARQRGIRITNDSLEFVTRSPAPVIGITGSAGKTTTTSLCGEIGCESGRKTWVGGNIGRPLLGDLGRIQAADLVIQELSSFQLEVWTSEYGNDEITGPSIAAVLNLTPNHLDRHKTMQAYAEAKANLLRQQSEESVTVLCADDEGAMSLANRARGRLRTYSAHGAVEDGAYVQAGQVWLRGDGNDIEVCQLGEISLRGEHNVLNVLAAVTLADCAGIDVQSMRRAITVFKGVPHRLEVVARIGGATYVNDSIATAPERSLAGIAAFHEPLVLLAGGRDKQMDWEPWARRVAQRVRHVVLFGDLAGHLDHLLKQQAGLVATVTRQESFEEAVECAWERAQPGDVVLLSPGGTSYDAFADFEERGERFRALVRELERKRVVRER